MAKHTVKLYDTKEAFIMGNAARIIECESPELAHNTAQYFVDLDNWVCVDRATRNAKLYRPDRDKSVALCTNGD
jgi:hypothetical protein